MSEHSKLLITESPLVVQPSLIKALGFGKAIILQQIQYLIANPKLGRVLDDGYKYIWETAQDFVEDFFPFWEADTVRKYLSQLEKDGLIIAQQPLVSEWNRTKFYRINYDALSGLSSASMSDKDAASMSDKDAASMSDKDAASLKEAKISSKMSFKDEEATALRIFREFYPHFKLGIYQEGLLATADVEETAFRQCVRFWAGRGYSEKNIDGILDCYQTNGYTKKSAPSEVPDIPKAKTYEEREAILIARGLPKIERATDV